ncbi:MAG: MBL fold metallo-hydrolase [bacterium]|nr:MBL fold metallo-hydrolase [Deltaproteobacteria bacterium]MCP4907525.1 MBL fold metallo-hydrolase [bacterium]
MSKRPLLASLGFILLGFGAAAVYFLATFAPVPVDPAWAVEGDATIPPGSVTVRFTGTSTLLFDDGETAWMVDGWFSRFGPLALLGGKIAPDRSAIEAGLARNEVDRLAVVIPVHSHFDHAMDAPEVAKRTGAILLGSESTANIGRGWGLDERRIRVAVDRQPLRFGAFTLTLIETKHFEFPDPAVREQALADPRISEPLVPPVGAFDYRVGQPYAIHVLHPHGSFLIQASAGYQEGGLAGFAADVVFLGIGGLGTQTADYRESYWRETVDTSGAHDVVLIHWDALTGPIEGPFTGEVRAASFLSSGSEETRTFLEEKRARDPQLRFRTLPRYDEVVLF